MKFDGGMRRASTGAPKMAAISPRSSGLGGSTKPNRDDPSSASAQGIPPNRTASDSCHRLSSPIGTSSGVATKLLRPEKRLHTEVNWSSSMSCICKRALGAELPLFFSRILSKSSLLTRPSSTSNSSIEVANSCSSAIPGKTWVVFVHASGFLKSRCCI